ncbi:hypothetical protein QQS21_003687 [Conoideocrella luteorostrata]|uniref:Uncharacterized protein n=1 Tax=Conoideocrella luteorostrata TaxID=1105319 RepID=A0AAJ0G250_9HYPO|nr:hypothetical protein QQS21_003687 [Conoideocrella luteorostrata]
MEAAAKTVEVLSKRILPEKPHHLAGSTTWRYRPPPEGEETESRGAKRRFEEWRNPRLQYLTFLSEADRGTLFTRPYYDMREEPLKPVPREVSALSKAGGTGEKKKLSLSDYKNKKTGVTASASPPEPAIAKRKESERKLERAPPPVGSATSTPTSLPADVGKPHQEPRRSDAPSIREPDAPSSSGAKPRSNREIMSSESRLPPKPASLPPRPPSPATKRRMPDADDDRPQKRSRPDDRRLTDNRLQRERDRDISHHRKDKLQPSSRDRDSERDPPPPPPPPPRDDRGHPSSSLPNGRSLLKGAMNPGRSTPPSGRPRGDSVNGVRPSGVGNSSSNRGAPVKLDVGSKGFVPPLLSPLNLSFDAREKERRLLAEDDDLSSKRERRRRDEADEDGAMSRARKTDAPPLAKKPKPPIVIPPLLSPTLPPAVEAELRRRKKSTSDSSDEKAGEGRDALGIKKRSVVDEDLDEDVRPITKPGHRRRMIVMLEVPKHLRASFATIVAQASGPRKDSQSQSEREHDRKPRAGSDDAMQQALARKRPVGSGEGSSDTIAIKRPQSSDVPGYHKLGTPSTPSKKTTAMSRVSSTNSMVQTPAELVNSTPSASASADRRPNGGDGPGNGERPEARAMKEKQDRLREVGKKLKHEADLTMKRNFGDGGQSMRDKPGEPKAKLGYVLSLESIIAFMMSFDAQNLWRGMCNKIYDPSGWNSMHPLMELLQGEMRRFNVSNYQPLYAMLHLLYAVSIDEMIKCYVHNDKLDAHIKYEELTKLERRKYKMWMHVHEANAAVPNARFRVDVQPWSSLDDITAASLRALRVWCDEERINWTPEQTLKENWPVRASHGRRQQ